MPATMNNGGDVLARGGNRATFRPAGENKTREEWSEIFDGEEPLVKKATYKFTCPTHGEFTSSKECFLSGGYPQLDEHTKGACPVTGCDEKKCEYAGYVEVE